MNILAKLSLRIYINGFLILLLMIFGTILFWSIYYIFSNSLKPIQIVFLIPLWLLILYFGRDLLWILKLLIGKAKYKDISTKTSAHEKILQDYINQK